MIRYADVYAREVLESRLADRMTYARLFHLLSLCGWTVRPTTDAHQDWEVVARSGFPSVLLPASRLMDEVVRDLPGHLLGVGKWDMACWWASRAFLCEPEDVPMLLLGCDGPGDVWGGEICRWVCQARLSGELPP